MRALENYADSREKKMEQAPALNQAKIDVVNKLAAAPADDRFNPARKQGNPDKA